MKRGRRSIRGHRQRGQVVFEYILVAFMISGVAMVGYSAIRRFVAKPLRAVKQNLEGDPNPMGKDAGTGATAPRQYYKDVRFGVK